MVYLTLLLFTSAIAAGVVGLAPVGSVPGTALHLLFLASFLLLMGGLAGSLVPWHTAVGNRLRRFAQKHL